jgi:hypothetical protein
MATIISNKVQVVATAKQFIAGVTEHFGSVTQITLLGRSFTPAEISSVFQSLVDLDAAVDAARVTTAAKVAAEAAQLPSVSALVSAMRTYVRATYGTSPDVLADFGLTPKARVQVSPETQVVANAKRKATRAARHTMGPKQKKGIKGTVTGPITIPTDASPAVTTAPAPATPVTNGTPQAAGAVTTVRPAS